MIHSVEKAMQIISFVAEQIEPVSLGRIAAALDMNKATCAHIVETLCVGHYLEKVSRKEGYILGPLSYLNTTGRLYKEDLVRSAAPIMTQLCQNVGESVSINCLANNRMYVLYTVMCQNEGYGRMGLKEGRLYQSAAGRLFLAHMSDRELNDIIERFGLPEAGEWDAARERVDLESQLRKIRNEGFAVREDEDLAAVSFPIFYDDVVIAGVGVYLPPERFGDAHRMKILNLTNEAAILITRRLALRRK